MAERPDAFEIPHDPSRVKLSPPVFPPGCYRAARRRPPGTEPVSSPLAETALGRERADPGPVGADMRTPDEIADALESLARELRRRGGGALRSSAGAPPLEVQLRALIGRFVADAPAGH